MNETQISQENMMIQVSVDPHFNSQIEFVDPESTANHLLKAIFDTLKEDGFLSWKGVPLRIHQLTDGFKLIYGQSFKDKNYEYTWAIIDEAFLCDTRNNIYGLSNKDNGCVVSLFLGKSSEISLDSISSKKLFQIFSDLNLFSRSNDVKIQILSLNGANSHSVNTSGWLLSILVPPHPRDGIGCHLNLRYLDLSENKK